MSATQTVNGVTTPLTLVNGQVPAETVTGTTQNTTINITWGAVATATLTGNITVKQLLTVNLIMVFM